MQATLHGEAVASVPLDDIAAVIVNAHGASYTNALITDLASRSIPIILCGTNHMPMAYVQPTDSNFKSAKYLMAQADLSKPKMKKAWKAIVAAKIAWQHFALATIGVSSAALERMSRSVKSGDPNNLEAQAARLYWRAFMGPDFRRDVGLQGANQMLNYGYTVLRAATCRALMSTGLYPSFGVHHRSVRNSFQLVDDLMEPFRPLIDLNVRRIIESGREDIDAEVKNEIAQSVHESLPGNGQGPLMNHIYRVALDYRCFICKEVDEVTIPCPPNRKPPLPTARTNNGKLERISADVAISDV